MSDRRRSSRRSSRSATATNSATTSADEEARNEQVARDLQLAYELEAQQEHEVTLSEHQYDLDSKRKKDKSTTRTPPRDRASSASSTGSGSAAQASPFTKTIGNMFTKKSSSDLLTDDGSSSMKSNGSLLYVPCEINSRMVEMMIDSGSQTSVISSSMMRKLQLEKRLNTRYQGVAAGVGAAKILGRIDNCAVMVGAGVEFHLFFLVIDVSHDMMILGIDQMRRFNCLIDLQRDVLIFGGMGGVEVPFLPPDPSHADARDQCTVSTIQSQEDNCSTSGSSWYSIFE